MNGARYIIGIDLGTSNIAVAYLDTCEEDPSPAIFPVLQITAEGECDERPLLPSFLYLPNPGTFPAGSLDLPWASDRTFCVGELARKNAALLPDQTVSSAKSWLCVGSVDRLAPILPWNRQNPELQMSPVDAARCCLEHIRDAWNHVHRDAEARFEEQEIVLTVPASFDAVARELTVKAATDAGLEVILLEEPQAAFYAWLRDRQGDWRELVRTGDKVLVCDVGGGTTDFSLIEVLDESGDLALRRVAVGEHILLGGDNMDLTLAHTVAKSLQDERGMRLDAYQIAGLTHACRHAKESLCGSPDAPAVALTVLGRGSSVIGGTISTEVDGAAVDAALLDGFFPECGFGEQPRQAKRSGLRAFGLQYAADPAITRHLSAFLARHLSDGDHYETPAAVLFNGGVTKAGAMRERILAAISGWLPEGAEPPTQLASVSLDQAVARGACWYGNVRRGNAIRIKAGSSHSYYIGVESSMPAVPGFEPPVEALCIVPFGMEEGSELDVPHGDIGLVVGATTEFRFFASSGRTDDEGGARLPDASDEALHELPVLAATLPVEDDAIPAGSLVPVRLHTVLSEIGTLEVWCLEANGERRWKLLVELRAVDLGM